MNSFLWRNVGVPLLNFTFGFLGDHLWIVAILVVLALILVWRFLMPVVWGFNALFGWKGWATLAVALLTFGAFGAGWRAHRASVLDPASPEYHGGPLPKPRKPAPVPSEYSPFGAPENTPKPKRKTRLPVRRG